ncbi:MAG: hypothetical protein ACR2HA_12260 [Nocardioides sp.]
MPPPRVHPAAAGSVRPLQLSRRSSLAALVGIFGTVGVGTTSCTAYDDRPDRPDRPGAGRTSTPTPSTFPEADPDVALAASVLAGEQDMVDRIDAAVAAHPALARTLTSARAVHVKHVELLTEAGPVAPSATPSPQPGRPRRRPSRARDRASAITTLARHEVRLSLVSRRRASAAESGAFARVLASMAAAASQQAAVLQTVIGGPP